MQENIRWTDYRASLKERIVDRAMHLFVQQGIKAVRMDDIAHSLSISKRTLYEIYDNKETLLVEVMLKVREREDAELKAISQRSKNVMETILNVYYLRTEQMRNTNPQFFMDLAKYPSVMKILKSSHERTHSDFMLFMERGVGEGYFRSDINYELVYFMFNAFSEQCKTENIFQKYSLESIFRNNVFVVIRGICTQKGIDLLEQFMQGEKR